MFRMRVLWSGTTGGPGVSTFYFNDDLTTGNVTAARSALNTFWTAVTLYVAIPATYAFDTVAEEVEVTTGHVLNALPVGAGSSPGSASGEMLPPATQALIRWRTGVYRISAGPRPRSVEIRGRTFVPAITEANSNGGVPLATMQTALTNAAQALVADASTHLCIYSRAAKSKQDVTSGQCWNQFAILRSRRDA